MPRTTRLQTQVGVFAAFCYRELVGAYVEGTQLREGNDVVSLPSVKNPQENWYATGGHLGAALESPQVELFVDEALDRLSGWNLELQYRVLFCHGAGVGAVVRNRSVHR